MRDLRRRIMLILFLWFPFPNYVMYVDLKACVTRLPEEGYGSNVTAWPARLQNPPDRLQNIKMDAYISRKELFKLESKYWNEIIDGHVRVFSFELRNVSDMRAGFGGFAAALVENHLDSWVLNVVPIVRCNISTIMIEMDRILRPGRHVHIRDSIGVMDELQEIGEAMGWYV
ncbi:putative methyltransferase PMT11 [Abeliophyllum distichum]|uniref:Methyltransferase n=1 Tax=Abeliophyllum distichum TaxID=126358 RepID=A0ABD1ULB0_9LAMI